MSLITSAGSVTEKSKRLLPWLMAIAFFMESLDTTILNTAVPTISAALKVSPLSMKAVLASYTLGLAVFIPISGWMADRFGTRRIFASAIGIFSFGSFLCGISSDIHALIIFRVLQGCGGAMMVPVARLTMVRTFAKSDLIRVMSFVAIPSLIGPMIGPLIGALIVEYLHWRFIFFVNIPIGLIGLRTVYMHLPNYSEERVNPIDIVGMILFSSGIALLSYVLEIFGEYSIEPNQVLLLSLISLSLIVGYAIHASQVKFPLLRLNLFRIRTFTIAVTGNLVTRIGTSGVPFLLPLLYQVGFGYSPIQSGLLIMPQALAAMSTKFLMPIILNRFGYRLVLSVNTIVIGFFLLLFADVGLSTPIWLILLQVFGYGALTSLQNTSVNTLVYADISEEQASNANSISSTIQQISTSFGVAGAGLVTASFISNHLHSHPETLIYGIHLTFLTLGVFTMLSALIFWKLKNNDGDNVSKQRV